MKTKIKANMFDYTSREEVEKIIISTLDTVEENEKANILPRDEVQKVIDEIAKTPFGHAEGAGGLERNNQRNSKSKETTYFFCAWYSWRNEKRIFLLIKRVHAIGIGYFMKSPIDNIITPTDKRIIINNKCKELAYKTVFPERYSEYIRLKKLRSIRHLPEPPSKSITWLKKDEGGLVLAKFKETPSYLWIGTPGGWFKTKWKRNGRSAWLYLRDLGFPVPKKRNKRVWDKKMEAYAIINKI